MACESLTSGIIELAANVPVLSDLVALMLRSIKISDSVELIRVITIASRAGRLVLCRSVLNRTFWLFVQHFMHAKESGHL
jgi:hypothetical protein